MGFHVVLQSHLRSLQCTYRSADFCALAVWGPSVLDALRDVVTRSRAEEHPKTGASGQCSVICAGTVDAHHDNT